MERRPLGKTGVEVSVIAFGAGPVSGLMTGDDTERQIATVRRAAELGVNWFDTAAGYGQGKSEMNLGRAFAELDVAKKCHVATKVRLTDADLNDIRAAVHRSVESSLKRLGLPSVTVLQLHNSVTRNRGDEPTSITAADALQALDAFRGLRDEGLVDHFGLTGIGQRNALGEVLRSGALATIQVPCHVLDLNAELVADCTAHGVAVLAIRVFAGGALLDAEPSAHTLKTPFFPLDLYLRDRRAAERLAVALGRRLNLKELALRFVLGRVPVTTAIVGFGSPQHVEEVAAITGRGSLPSDVLAELEPVLRGIREASI